MSSLEELRPTGSSVSGWVFGYWGVSGEGLQVHIEMTSCLHTEVGLVPFIYANGVQFSCSAGCFYSLGCMRTWGQTEEPNTEPFAMDKEKFAIHFFSIFNDFKRIFLAWGLGVHINIYCGCQKNSPFHFFVQITVIFQSQFLNLEPCLEPMTLLKIFKRQFLYFFNSENPSSCQQQGWNI